MLSAMTPEKTTGERENTPSNGPINGCLWRGLKDRIDHLRPGESEARHEVTALPGSNNCTIAHDARKVTRYRS
jgi:hypothetical protein